MTASKKPVTIGNEIWFSAIDNNVKTAFTMSEQLMQEIADKLDRSGINYYAFSVGGAARICVNSVDTDKLLSVLGDKIAGLLKPQSLQKPYSPPEKNIIGNAEYRYIPQKTYHSTDTDIALRISYELEKQNIQYSGNVYNSRKTTLTVSKPDYKKLLEIEKQVLYARDATFNELIEKRNVNHEEIHDSENKQQLQSGSAEREDNEVSRIRRSGKIRSDEAEIHARGTAGAPKGSSGFRKAVPVSESVRERDSESHSPTRRKDYADRQRISDSTGNGKLYENGRSKEQLPGRSGGNSPDSDDLQLKIVGNTAYKNIADKVYYNNILTEDLYYKYAKNVINAAAIPYSGTIKNDMITFTVSSENALRFEKVMTAARNTYLIETDLEEKGFSSEQIEALPFIHEAAVFDYFSISNHLKPEYNNDMLTELAEKIVDVSRVQAANGTFSKEYNDKTLDIVSTAQRFDLKISLEKQNYSTEQQHHIISAVEKGLDISSIGTIDNTFSVDEIDRFTNLLISGNFKDALEFAKNREESNKKVTAEYDEKEPDNFNIIHNAFEKLIANHNFSETALELLERTKKQMNINGYSELDPKIYHLPHFERAYGRISRINDTIFDGKLKDIIHELNGYINGYLEKEQVLQDEQLSMFDNVNTLSAPKKTTGELFTEAGITENPNRQSADDFFENTIDDYLSLPDKSNRINGLSIGDKIEVESKQWQVDKIDGDFSIFLTNLDKNDIQSSMVIIGNWKDKLDYKLLEDNEISADATNLKLNQLSLFDVIAESPAETVVEAAAPTKIKGITPEKNDFHITEDIQSGGAKAKFRNNIEAIKTLRTIESEKRLATPEEQKILAKYVGWGGLSQAFDEHNSDWNKEYRELSALLTPEEYNAAKRSTNTAFYTSPDVIEEMYFALKNLGFEGGRVLEPAIGTGNFFGKMPEDIQKNSQLSGIELDKLSGRIAGQLYQNADIQIKGFEKTNFRDNSFDLAIGNIPFGDIQKDNVLKRYPAQIENIQQQIKGIEAELLYLKDRPDIFDDKGKKILNITINGIKYTDRETAGKALNETITKAAVGSPNTITEIGEYKGFKLSVSYDSMFQKFTGELFHDVSHKFELGTSPTGNITRIENVISSLEATLDSLNAQLNEINIRLADGKEEMNKPFPQSAELHDKMDRLEEIERLLTAEKEEKTNSDGKAPDEKPMSESEPKEKPLFSRAIQKDFSDKAKGNEMQQPENEKSAI